MRLKLHIIIWRLLRYSGVFRYWYKRFLTELICDLERFDLEGNEIMQKYLMKLNHFKY